MNLTDEKLTGEGMIDISDSLNAPLLELRIYNNADAIIPLTDDLIIYVDKEETATENRRQYVFLLSDALKYYNGISDEFLIKADFQNNSVAMKAFVKRLIGETEGVPYLLENEEIEEMEYQTITLFEGVNYIYTNYDNVSIELVYPKNNDLNNRFLSNVIYNEHRLNSEDFSLDDLYFKDAFTESEDGININANNIDVNCVTSRQNNFSIDSAGNLSVSSITSVEEIVPTFDYSEIFDLVYPVGSIYLSINSTNPSNYFEGSWTAWGTGRVPVGIDVSQTEFNTVEKTGGSKTHTLTVAQMPSHTHTQNSHLHDIGRDSDGGSGTSRYTVHGAGVSGANHTSPTSSVVATNQNTGGDGSHNNLQPYITCYMWKRVS